MRGACAAKDYGLHEERRSTGSYTEASESTTEESSVFPRCKNGVQQKSRSATEESKFFGHLHTLFPPRPRRRSQHGPMTRKPSHHGAASDEVGKGPQGLPRGNS